MGSEYSNNSSCESRQHIISLITIILYVLVLLIVLDIEKVSDEVNEWQDLGYIPTTNNKYVCHKTK